MTRALRAALATMALLATPMGVQAQDKPKTKLVECGVDSCLQIDGERRSAASPVLINGHAIQVQGRHHWRARLPVSTIRDWSVPFARRIEVSTGRSADGEVASEHVLLPIGLLGHTPDLAALVITLR